MTPTVSTCPGSSRSAAGCQTRPRGHVAGVTAIVTQIEPIDVIATLVATGLAIFAATRRGRHGDVGWIGTELAFDSPPDRRLPGARSVPSPALRHLLEGVVMSGAGSAEAASRTGPTTERVTMSPIITTTSNATLDDLVELLRDQRSRRIDLVTPAVNLRSRDGLLHISAAAPVLEADGVTDPNGVFVPTEVCDEGIADKLKIPTAYLGRLRGDRTDLYDANVNGWLHGKQIRRAAASVRPSE